MDLILDGNGPLHGQLYRALKAAMVGGRLPQGARLPASRELAQSLGLSRTTVVTAYEQLRTEGLLTGKVGSGSYVSLPWQANPRGPAPRRMVLPQSAYSRRGREVHDHGDIPGRRLDGMRHAFQFGVPVVNTAITSQWARELTRVAPYAHPNYPKTQGLPALREAIATHISRSRGVRCTPDDILVTCGVQQAVNLSARVLLDPGDEVVIEEPQYFGTRRVLQMHGAQLTGVAVDRDGLRTDELPPRYVKLVSVTPSHQFPTGAVLSHARRLALLDYVRRGGGWILEDDYDGEFRHDGVPVESLQSLDRDDRVIYIGSFSKTLFPALRLGYLVMPAGLKDDFIAAKWADDFGTPAIEQLALANLIASGAYDRHLRLVTRKLAERRQVLSEALAEIGRDRIEVLESRAGMHLMVWLKGVSAEQGAALVRHAQERQLGLYPVDPCYLVAPRRAGLIMGFSAMSTKELREAIAMFRRCLDDRDWAASGPRRRGGLVLAHSA